MTIFEKLNQDWLQARKDKNTVTATVLGTFLSEMKSKITKGLSASVFGIYKPTDDEVIANLNSTIRTLKSGLATAESQNNTSVYVTKTKVDIELLESYLPTKMLDSKLQTLVVQYTQEALDSGKTGGAILGFVMSKLKENYPNQYDASKARTYTTYSGAK